ncbi:hypothetical protein [Pelagibacterium mangrovi]|uniref:hypothetical protein n=1 Tax=Pelagibacterium mangrovi TaxID=3119828 RepID=UPI002FC68034
MKRSAFFASIALTAGLAMPAFAQEIGGVTVSEEDWGLVQQRCTELQGEPIPEFLEDEPLATEQVGAPEGIDISQLTREDCEEAGLIGPTDPLDTVGGSSDDDSEDGGDDDDDAGEVAPQ